MPRHRAPPPHPVLPLEVITTPSSPLLCQRALHQRLQPRRIVQFPGPLPRALLPPASRDTLPTSSNHPHYNVNSHLRHTSHSSSPPVIHKSMPAPRNLRRDHRQLPLPQGSSWYCGSSECWTRTRTGSSPKRNSCGSPAALGSPAQETGHVHTGYSSTVWPFRIRGVSHSTNSNDLWISST